MKIRTVILLLFFLSGCGKKGDPVPPVPIIPAATTDLAVAQRGPKIVLSWSYPSLTTAGAKLGKIDRIVVYRYIEGLPASLAGTDPRLQGATNTTEPREIALFAEVPTIVPQQFAKLKTKVDALDSAVLPQVTAGARILYEDEPAPRTDDGRPVRITYGVVTEGKNGTSPLSNLVSIVPLITSAAPADLTATQTPPAIVLKWTAPGPAQEGQPAPTIMGYNIYRAPADAANVLLDKPINNTPATATTYSDTPPYGVYRYAVTAVSRQGPPLVQSEPSATVTAEFRDLLAPPAPASVTTLIEQGAVRLIWDPVDAPDLAGYKVYRSVGGRTTPLTAEVVKEPNFLDTTAQPGVPYTYSVTSVDQRGNESAGTIAPEITIQR